MPRRVRRTTAHPFLAVLTLGCALVPSAGCGAPEGSGARLVTICAPCHRLDGRNTGISSLLRWEPEEIVDKLHDFRSDARAGNAMRAVSRSLSDDEIAAVADQIAALAKKAKPP